MITKKLSLICLLAGVLFSSCSSDDDAGDRNAELTLNVIGLQELNNTSEYEAWIVVNGSNVSLGRFTDTNFPKDFRLQSEVLNNASRFMLSIEPGNDSNSTISNTVILSGDFSGNSASLTINEAIGNFAGAQGEFVLETPTDDDPFMANANDQAGIHWYVPNENPPRAGLNLPNLPNGWKYEGWVVLPTSQGTVNVSTGTFSRPEGADDFAPYSGNQPAPAFPGEDFLNNSVAPAGVNFPPDLRGKKVFISIEPFPDTDQAPFFIRPLDATATEVSPFIHSMNLNSASFPLGSVTRE